jgi:ATP-dependent Lhr-like helicase
MTQINYSKKRTDAQIKKVLHPLVSEWFFRKFENFSEPQRYGVLSIWERKNILISAPTGGTKTLTAFLSILNHLVSLAEAGKLEDKIYAIYSSPLKALSNDIHKNLVEPLEEIMALAESKGKKLQKIRVALRTGDTTQSEKAKMARNIPHILVTTPESIAIVLTSKKFVEAFKAVEFCIVDEIHALDNKRGVHLSLSLERLNEMSSTWPVKIGLSATVEPLEDVAKFLVGTDEKDPNRNVEIAKVPFGKKIDIDVLTPVPELIKHENPHKELYPLLHKLVSAHKTTLIFTNTRAATERVVNYLKDKFPTEYGEDNIAAHHSSLSKSHRFDIEERLRQGLLKVVVCSTSLELGIDIGFIDLVILLGSPKASSRALQRIGRAGHKLHAVAKGRFVVTDRDDLVECCVIQKEMIENKIDRITFPKNALDVLSQQIYGMAIYKIWDVNELLKTIRKSYCYSDLSKKDFLSVISYLTGDYGLEESNVYGKIWYDVEKKQIGKKGKLARVIYMTNIGTIPEESFITVKISPSGDKIGVIDENFLSRMKKNDVFVLGGRKYQYQYTKGMNLYVKDASTKSPTIPSWASEALPLSFDSALEINNFRKLIKELLEIKSDKEIKKFTEKYCKESTVASTKQKNSDPSLTKYNERSEANSKQAILEFIKKYVYVNESIAKEVYEYFHQQYKFHEIPNTNLITIEKYIDERDNKKYLLVNAMYGRRVNDALSRAIGFLMGKSGMRDVEIGVSDRGFYISSENQDIEKAIDELTPENIEKILKEAIEKTDILTRRFRHCATRSLMILKSYKGQSKSVKKQQMKSHFLINAVKKISSEFPILNEAKREVLEDLMDIQNAKLVLKWIKTGEVQISSDYVRIPSPFALNLILQGHLDLMRIEDKQDFLKRMHQVYIDEIKKKENPEFIYGDFGGL